MGCASQPIWPFNLFAPKPAPQTSTAAEPVSSKEPVSPRGVRVVHLAFDVLRAELPVEGEMNSLKVWNHVDGLRAGPEAVALLSRNGLRIGAGSSANWAAIKTILDAGRAKTFRDQLLAQSGAPLLIELGVASEGESIFAYNKDMRLQGKSFAGGSKILQLDYAFRPDLGGTTDLQVSFEIRRELGEMVWEKQADGSIRQVPGVERHAFDELKSALTLQQGEFLVIGPSEQAQNEYRVGSRFLMNGAGTSRREALYFITPQPFRTEESKKP